jgi:DNA invertase Pin-like site-specific DNA recombinase
LVERAQALGWPAERIQVRIQVIDDDLGQSGQDSTRKGFQALVSAVSLGQVGLILAYEASRLARNNADWYRLLDLLDLLDLAALVGALLADTDGVYDPCDYNDRLLLGLRGMLSAAELHLLQLRLQAGRQRQIAQGTYRQHLPTGLVRLPDGRVANDPDLQIQRTIALVFERFERFARLGSGQQALRSFREEGILLPRRQTAGRYAGELWWKRPSAAALYAILRNPAYAGAFISGRTTTRPERRPGQPGAAWALCATPAGRVDRAPPRRVSCLYQLGAVREQFMANQMRLADNASSFARRTRSASRQGPALLAGLVVCGRCGHQMRVAYKAHQRSFCTALTDTYRAPMCLSVDGSGIDAALMRRSSTRSLPPSSRLSSICSRSCWRPTRPTTSGDCNTTPTR